ncbi:MAG: asparaginase [Halanaerobiales bacterium]|nr:asparaginase [Halanaerobiales bacterium]
MKKRVYIVYTGGTIGMTPSPDGYVPTSGYLKRQMEAICELKSDIMPEYDIHEYDPLLDSSNMTPDNWITIAADIAKNYNNYDGFVVIHGTDTMAYTASALSFMLEGLQKPVIITGSQIPLCEVRNDARENLITAIMIAGNYKIPEVCLYFGDKLLRGCRSVKVNADHLDAFVSPNFPPLGTVGVDIRINWDLVLSQKNKTIKVNEFGEESIGTLRLFPGITAEVVENILQPPLKGLILGTYGVGNGPDQNKKLLKVLKEATDRGVVIVACTQCLQGGVKLGGYAAGSALAKAGIISGYDMTTEAALSKLYYLFSQGLSVEDVKKKMQTNICGELTAL